MSGQHPSDGNSETDNDRAELRSDGAPQASRASSSSERRRVTVTRSELAALRAKYGR